MITMASEQKIDHIDYNGQTYQFVDQSARDSVTSLSQRVTRLNDKQVEDLGTEVTRAKAAEKALQDSKVDQVAGKGLSTNDFDDDYKDLLDNPPAMVGATAMTDGAQGDVPKPLKAEAGLFLRGDGTWAKPQDTTYEKATQSSDGLMSKEDKTKLDAMDQDTDDTVACETTFTGNQITQVLGNGKTRTTTFNNDGTITETIAKTGMETITLTTTFNNDGSISRVRS